MTAQTGGQTSQAVADRIHRPTEQAQAAAASSGSTIRSTVGGGAPVGPGCACSPWPCSSSPGGSSPAAGWVDPKFVPTPSSVWARFQQSIHTETRGTADFPIVKRGLQNYYLWQHWWASMRRVLWGLLWAIVIGVPLGLLLATVRWFRVFVEPYVDFLRALPPLAYFSLLILWFGIGDSSKIWLLFFAGLAPVALSIVSGTRGIPRDRLLAAQALGASRLQTVRYLVLPSVLPELFNGLRLAVGFIFTTIVAAETTAGLPGIGGLAWVSKKTGNADTVILCIIVIGLTALALDGIVKALERWLVPWRGRG